MKSKILPLIVGGVIIALGLIIFIVSKISQEQFSKLIITYKGDIKEYTKVKVNDIYVVNNVTFTVVGTNPDKIVLYSSDEINNENEHEINLNKQETLCFTQDNCVYWDLK